MLTYLEKFKTLPKAIQAKVDSPAVMASVTRLSQEYKVNLAALILKIMVKEVKLENLRAYLINEFQMPGELAQRLENSLRREVFADVIDFLLGVDQKAALVFSESDEKEVRTVKKPVSTQHFDDDIEAQVEEILKQSRVNFSDPLGSGKFRQVIKTYLRGSRDKVATLEALTKAAELGGVALNRDTAERVMIIATNFLTKQSGGKKVSTPGGGRIAPLTEEYDLVASLKTQGKLKTAVPRTAIRPHTVLDTSHELMPPVPSVRTAVPVSATAPNPASRQIVKEVVRKQKVDSKAIKNITSSPSPQPVENLQKSTTGKIKMDDIRYEAKALSPVEELRYFTLVNFRRLDPDPTKAMEKITSKLELLGKENYSKKIEGINAWNESPLNRLYLAVCRRSLEEGMPLSAVLERELQKDKNFLRPDELSAIIHLNQTLKF